MGYNPKITSELDMTKHKRSMVANSFYYVYLNTTSDFKIYLHKIRQFHTW